jgi:anaerobic selenocysteine-containing dehydrogenase
MADIHDASHSLTDTTVHFRTCPLCEAMCGLELTMDGDTVVRVRGDRDDPFSRGFVCPKGASIGRLHDDPDRLRVPVIRRGDDPATATWDEVSWDEAFSEVQRLLVPVLDTHGRDAAAVYLGNPNVHNPGNAVYGRPLIRALGTRNIFSASTVDQMPKHVSSGFLFGSPDAIPVPDLDRTDFIVLLGANPAESNGSLCTAADFMGRLDAVQARGGTVVVVDPRRTKTAEHADVHLSIRPGTDAHLLVGLIALLFARDLVDLGAVGELVDPDDLRAVRDAVAPWTLDAVATATGIDAAAIDDLAGQLAAAPSAVVYGRIGTHTVEFGTVASWATDVLNVLTGNLDRPGGAMFPLAAHQQRGKGSGRGFITGRHTSRVKGYPEVRSELPVATLADEIETPGEGQVRALITVAGNPVLSCPDSTRMDAALATLDAMVSIDPYLNETTRHAHVILPPPGPLTRSHYDLAFTTLSVRNVVKWSPAAVAHDGPQEHEILARLALIVSGLGATADPGIIDAMVLDAVVARGAKALGRDAAELAALTDGPGRSAIDRVLDAMIRLGAYGDGFGATPDGLDLDQLADAPHGVDLGPLDSRLPEILKTPSGRIDIAAPVILADLPRLQASLDRPERLVLVGRRHLRSNNSWMHNVEVLVKGKVRCTLQVHPDDAAELGLAHGDAAEVRSRVGAVVAPVEVTDAIRPGVVSLPHGWGHDRSGTRMGVATEHAGVNANVLTDPDVLDALSGNAVLNAIPVTVTPA